MLKHIQCLYIFVACSLLSGCGVLDNTAESVCNPVNFLRSLDFDTLSPESLPEWVAEHYAVPETDLLTYHHGDGLIKEIQWEYYGRIYAAFFDRQFLRSVIIRPVVNDIRAYQVMKCFGAPNFYGAYVVLSGQQRTYEVHLWYPEIGLAARYSMVSTTGNSSPTIGEYSPVDVVVFRPNSLDKAITEAYIPGTEFLPSE